MNMTLTDFLLARIAEDEGEAERAIADRSDHAGDMTAPYYADDEIGQPMIVGAARVLAECSAKRRIVDWVQGSQRYAREYDPAAFHIDEAEALTHCLQLLALPYADHPDYDESWRP